MTEVRAARRWAIGSVVILLGLGWGVPVSASQASGPPDQSTVPDPGSGSDPATSDPFSATPDSGGSRTSAFESEQGDAATEPPGPSLSESIEPIHVDEVTDALETLGPDGRTACVDDDGSQLCARQYVRGDTGSDAAGDPQESQFNVSGALRGAAGSDDWAPECTGSGRDGYRVYGVHAYTGWDQVKIHEARDRIRVAMANMDRAFSESASATGGSRHIRWATNGGAGSTDCSVQLYSYQVTSGANSFDDLIDQLAGRLKPDDFYNDNVAEKYIIWTEGDLEPSQPSVCGLGLNFSDDMAGSLDNLNADSSVAAVKEPCWDLDGGGSVPAHELMHTLGAVQPTAPHADGYGHCTDDHDLMCYGPRTQVVSACSDPALEARFDCNHDDYFHTDPAAGSYLCRFWNTARSPYLHGFDEGVQPLTPPRASVSGRSGGIQLSWTPGAECPGPSAIGVDIPGAGTGIYPMTTTSTFIKLPPGTYTVEVAALRDGEVRSTYRTVSVPAPPNRIPVGKMVLSVTDGRGYGMLGYAIDPDTGGPVRMRMVIPGVVNREYNWNYRWADMRRYTGWNRTEAFLFLAQLPPGTHRICFDARDANTGGWTRLECRTHTVK